MSIKTTSDVCKSCCTTEAIQATLLELQCFIKCKRNNTDTDGERALVFEIEANRYINHLNATPCLKPQIEKTHLQFFKHHLEINNKAYNVACRAELRRLPLNITIKKSSTTFCILSLKMKNLSLSNLFLMSFDLYCNGKSSFHSHLMKLSEYFNISEFNTDLLDTAIVKNFVCLMKQEYISY